MVIAGPVNMEGVTLYIKDVTTSAFSIKAFFWDDAFAVDKTGLMIMANVMVAEEGNYVLYDGTKIIAGKTKITPATTTSKLTYNDNKDVFYYGGISSDPIILLQQTTFNSDEMGVLQVGNKFNDKFTLTLQL